MDPEKIPFNALIVGPTHSGKTSFVLDQLWGPFRKKFSRVVIICPTLLCNKTWKSRLPLDDEGLILFAPQQHEVELYLKLTRLAWEGENTLVVLDDCAASRDVKGRTGELVNLAFSARHFNFSVWVLTQRFTSISASFRDNIRAVVLFHTTSSVTKKSYLR